MLIMNVFKINMVNMHKKCSDFIEITTFFCTYWGKINTYITFVERKKHDCYIVLKLIQGAVLIKLELIILTCGYLKY